MQEVGTQLSDSSLSLREQALVHADLKDAEDREAFWNHLAESEALAADQYLHYSADVPVNPNVVFYETMASDRMNDSPFALFEYLRAHPEYGTFLHVWSVKDFDTVPERYRDADDVVLVHRDTRAYAYFFACAEHLITNGAFPSFFVRRNEQKFLNTWHGVPYKKIGRDRVRAMYGGPPLAILTLLKATHVISPCDFMTQKIGDAYSMRGVSQTVVAETGYPRIDITLNTTVQRKDEIRRQIGLGGSSDSADRRPTVLFAPTWRTEERKQGVDEDQIVHDLNALAALDIDLLFRGHHKTSNILSDLSIGEDARNVFVPSLEINSNELLSVADVVISDYSSIFLDLLPTGRPVINYLYDLDLFAQAQGLYLSTDELPGDVAYTREELVQAVQQEADRVRKALPETDFAHEPLQGQKYQEVQQRFWPHEDGESSRRAIEFFFAGKTDGLRLTKFIDDRPSLAFYFGDLHDSPETEGFALYAAQQGASKDRQTALLFNNLKRRLNDIVLDSFATIRRQSATVPMQKHKVILLSEEEQVAFKKFNARKSQTFTDVAALLFDNAVLRDIVAREYKARLDERHFEEVHLAPGLSNLDLALAVFAIESAAPFFSDDRPTDHTSATFGELCAAHTVELKSSDLVELVLKERLRLARADGTGERSLSADQRKAIKDLKRDVRKNRPLVRVLRVAVRKAKTALRMLTRR